MKFTSPINYEPRTNYPIAQTRRRLRRRVVLNLGHLDFDIVSNFELRISDFASLGIFTLVKSPLQIAPFMQNKPNLLKDKIDAKSVYTNDYENKHNWTLGENKPNTNPIKPNTKPIKANKMPKQTQYKPNQTQFQRQKKALTGSGS